MSLTITLDVELTRRAQLPERLTFVEAPPGMAALTGFDVSALDEAGLLFALRASEQPDTRLFAVPPRPYFPTYQPRLSEDAREAIGLGDDEEPVLLVIVHPGADAAHTANLLAPVAVNPRTGSAAQVVLDDGDWPLRAPLGAAAEPA